MSRKFNFRFEIVINAIHEMCKSELPSRIIAIVCCSRTTESLSIMSRLIKPNNVRDHRAGTSDHPLQKHAQVRLRVHHIVIMRVPESGQSTNTLGHAAVETHSVQECLCSHNQLIRATLQVSVFGRSDFHCRFHLRLF